MNPIDNHIARPPTRKEERRRDRGWKRQEMQHIKDRIEYIEIDLDNALSVEERYRVQNEIDKLNEIMEDGEF